MQCRQDNSRVSEELVIKQEEMPVSSSSRTLFLIAKKKTSSSPRVAIVPDPPTDLVPAKMPLTTTRIMTTGSVSTRSPFLTSKLAVSPGTGTKKTRRESDQRVTIHARSSDCRRPGRHAQCSRGCHDSYGAEGTGVAMGIGSGAEGVATSLKSLALGTSSIRNSIAITHDLSFSWSIRE
ncbi:unnamed protein product [Phytophthora fragariaefolia]|uniref:Unnamed protein product n=1 Tax=Phytophthora fragariaefolia TaxID=1490495 RepID=A0A9W6WPC9_9STRA|nr:unnamed protein product [Phytophthora fragariaefolia]